MRDEVGKLLKQLKKRYPADEVKVVREAYRVANDVHGGQFRISGEPYITHPIAVAQLLASVGMDSKTLAAGLLHDVLEDTPYTKEELEAQFGSEIAELVDGVSKIASIHFSSETLTRQEKQAENLRKMLIATANDIRVILIKLADRLHNMRTLDHLPQKKVDRISRETRDIYAPIANRLGMAQWRWELEDHAFRHLNPVEYKAIAERVAMRRREREEFLAETVSFLEKRLNEAEVTARVIGRPKHLYSIYRKMVTQGKDFNQVMDVVGIRILTQTLSDSYNALGLVHQLWTPVPGRFKDYIALPKLNMYQSVHTTVMRENGLPMEVQIRTEEMDRTAREGVAAHWMYKEGHDQEEGGALNTQIQWLRTMNDWLVDASAPDELLDSLRRDVGAAYIYVFTPKGEVKELPSGATPLDMAYHIHTHIGHQCWGARIDGRMVPLTYHLQMGDVVEIITRKNQQPDRSWLDIVVTGKARTRIRQRLRELGELNPLDMAIEFGPEDTPPPRKQMLSPEEDAARKRLIKVIGGNGADVHFAKCCKPMPGQPVLGYTTRAHGITVHRADCRHFARTGRSTDRIVPASWAGEGFMEAEMRVIVRQRPNVLADITEAIRPLNVSVTQANFTVRDDGSSVFAFTFQAPDEESIDQVRRNIKHVAGVTKIKLLSEPVSV